MSPLCVSTGHLQIIHPGIEVVGSLANPAYGVGRQEDELKWETSRQVARTPRKASGLGLLGPGAERMSSTNSSLITPDAGGRRVLRWPVEPVVEDEE